MSAQSEVRVSDEAKRADVEKALEALTTRLDRAAMKAAWMEQNGATNENADLCAEVIEARRELAVLRSAVGAPRVGPWSVDDAGEPLIETMVREAVECAVSAQEPSVTASVVGQIVRWTREAVGAPRGQTERDHEAMEALRRLNPRGFKWSLWFDSARHDQVVSLDTSQYDPKQWDHQRDDPAEAILTATQQQRDTAK